MALGSSVELLGGEDRPGGRDLAQLGVHLALEVQDLGDGLDHQVGLAHRHGQVR